MILNKVLHILMYVTTFNVLLSFIHLAYTFEIKLIFECRMTEHTTFKVFEEHNKVALVSQEVRDDDDER